MSASLLHLNAIHLMKGVLVGTETKKLQDVLEAAFCEEDAKDDDFILDKEEETEETKPEEEASTSTGVKRKAPPPTSASKCSKAGICALSDATVHYPTTGEAQSSAYLHTSVDPKFYSSHKSSAKTKSVGYECQFAAVKREEGLNISDCTLFSTTKSQLSTHIQQHHLGVAIGCYICPTKRWWSSASWMEHMKKCHPDLKSDCFFVKEGADLKELSESLIVNQEVVEDDIWTLISFLSLYSHLLKNISVFEGGYFFFSPLNKNIYNIYHSFH